MSCKVGQLYIFLTSQCVKLLYKFLLPRVYSSSHNKSWNCLKRNYIKNDIRKSPLQVHGGLLLVALCIRRSQVMRFHEISIDTAGMVWECL